MGLVKRIELPNGVTVDYHRIVSVNTITNNCNIIEVASYVSKAKRIEEAECTAALASGDNSASCNVYIDTAIMSAEYDPDMTIESAYEWLKGQDGFDGAEDDSDAIAVGMSE